VAMSFESGCQQVAAASGLGGVLSEAGRFDRQVSSTFESLKVRLHPIHWLLRFTFLSRRNLPCATISADIEREFTFSSEHFQRRPAQLKHHRLLKSLYVTTVSIFIYF
jgi:hypothetical protein